MGCVDGIVVVLHPSHTVRFANELTMFDDAKPLLIAEGGATRPDSVRAGLLEVPDSAAVIAVHDGARPLFSKHVFEACLAALKRRGRRRPGRRGERHAQAAGRGRRGGGHRRPRRPVGGADAAGVPRRRPARRVRAHGPRTAPPTTRCSWSAAATPCGLVPSTPANVKITTPADLPLAGALLSWEVETDV